MMAGSGLHTKFKYISHKINVQALYWSKLYKLLTINMLPPPRKSLLFTDNKQVTSFHTSGQLFACLPKALQSLSITKCGTGIFYHFIAKGIYPFALCHTLHLQFKIKQGYLFGGSRKSDQRVGIIF